MLQVVPPITVQLHTQGRYRELEHVLRSIATLATLPAALVLVIFTAAGGLVMSAVYGPFYRQGASVLAILCLARLLAVAAGPCGSTLMMTGHHRAMMFITIVCGAFSVLAGIGMVFTFGMVGVAVSTCLGQILQNALMLTFVKRRLGIWTHARLSLEPLREVLRTAHEVVARNAEGRA
jgi:O-antigen/teichoic acid export membrane protein